jgi:hypothetical protein
LQSPVTEPITIIQIPVTTPVLPRSVQGPDQR